MGIFQSFLNYLFPSVSEEEYKLRLKNTEDLLNSHSKMPDVEKLDEIKHNNKYIYDREMLKQYLQRLRKELYSCMNLECIMIVNYLESLLYLRTN